MRLRNVPGADDALKSHHKVIKEEKAYKGKWNEVFGNDRPIFLEIGMGKGQFLISLAKRNPDKNYIGIERYSSVLFRALERYDERDEEIENLRFLCMDAAELEDVFCKDEVGGIFLNFSDPWPKARHARRRLTSKEFFGRYANILEPDAAVEFKTDNKGLFEFSLEEIQYTEFHIESSTFDLHHDSVLSEGNIMTEYEEKFSSMGNPIYKLTAKRNKAAKPA